MRRKFKVLILAISAIIISFGCHAAIDNYREVKKTQSEIQRLETERQNLHEKTEKLEQEKKKHLEQIQDQKKTEEQLREEIKSLQAAKAEKQRIAALASSQKASAATPKQGRVADGWHYECRSQKAAVQEATARLLGADAQYADFIFDHESCSDPGRLNSSGCGGLGQACPLSKMPCGPNDIDCQVRFFDGHAAGKGGWLASYNFWLANKWW